MALALGRAAAGVGVADVRTAVRTPLLGIGEANKIFFIR